MTTLITVKMLKDMLKGVPDDLVVVVPGSDHAYVEIEGAHTVSAGVTKTGMYSEWYGPKYASPGEEETEVFLIY